jgi:hypothetical protein
MLGLVLSFTLLVVVHAGSVSIATARALPLGSAISVSGRVTTPPGFAASSYCFDAPCTSSDCGMAIQDTTGALWVEYSCSNSAGPIPFVLGDAVLVTGILVVQGNNGLGNGMLAVAGALYPSGAGAGNTTVDPNTAPTIAATTLGYTVAPTSVAANATGSNAELVQIEGVVVSSPPPGQAGQVYGLDPAGCNWPPLTTSVCFGFKFWLRDTTGAVRVYINTPPGTNFTLPLANVAPGNVLRIVGLSGAFITPEVDIRFVSDIVLVAVPITSTNTTNSSTTSPANAAAAGLVASCVLLLAALLF